MTSVRALIACSASLHIYPRLPQAGHLPSFPHSLTLTIISPCNSVNSTCLFMFFRTITTLSVTLVVSFQGPVDGSNLANMSTLFMVRFPLTHRLWTPVALSEHRTPFGLRYGRRCQFVQMRISFLGRKQGVSNLDYLNCTKAYARSLG